jgi:hypothetical protein
MDLLSEARGSPDAFTAAWLRHIRSTYRQLIRVLTGQIKQQRIRLRVGCGPPRNASITARRHHGSYPAASHRSGAPLPHATPDERSPTWDTVAVGPKTSD